jgi:uncharacterized protein
LRHIDFLLPDPIAGQPVGDAGAYARCFRELLRAWLEDRPAEVRVRLFDSIVGLLTSGTTRLSGFGRTPDPAMTISVDGDIFTDDVLRSTEPLYFATGLHVDSSTIDEYLASEAFLLLKRASEALPDDCLTCDAAHACRGGQLVHRYRKGNGFANRSLYCDSLYALFCLAAEELLRSDRTAALLMSRLAERAAPAPAAFA